ncbi:MAG: SRPBCC family protein [Pseudobdellovibrionaceae bacterium]|nr:SRPBCC family protein [Bdellovibrionales bacterium]USN47079.1 MAG: SRPBCC family protein [Pseudobdellovibrionaceae bacterium]
MAVEVFESIKVPTSTVWKTVTDIENCDQILTAILRIEILVKPKNGIVGLKWRETRKMLGKEAAETMWITRAEEGHWYETQALNSGCEYNTRVSVIETAEGTKLFMRFDATPKTFLARLLSPLGFLFSGMIKKALRQDLMDIKNNLESR